MRISRWLVGVLLASVGLAASLHEAALVEAAKSGDVAGVRKLLENKSADVNVPSADGTTALHWAVDRDNAAMVEALLQAGADVKAANRYGVKPLSLAAETGDAAMVERLLKAGADPNTSMPEGETVLMTASRTGNPAAIKALLTHGANVNARDSYRGQTALMWAAARNNADAIRMLVEFGGDVKARTNNPAQGLDRRSEAGMFNSAPPTSFTALFFAVRGGHLEAVKALLEAGANVNDALSDGESVLVVAVANANWELANYLLDKGADPNLAGAGWNALHQAIRERRPNVSFGVPGPIPNGKVDSIDVIKKMIAKGANLNARMTRNGMKDGQRNRLNRLGSTAFFLAAKNTDVEAMRVLAAAGADANIPNAEHTTPLMVAAGIAIWNPGEDGGSLPGQEDEVLAAVKLCVELGNDVNATDDSGYTALHGVAFRGGNSIVEYLVSKGAKLDAKEKHGWTPLAIANGLSYTDFFKQQTVTADLLRKLMKERGLSTEGQAIGPEVCLDCIQTHLDQIRAVAERDRRMEAEFNQPQNAASKK